MKYYLSQAADNLGYECANHSTEHPPSIEVARREMEAAEKQGYVCQFTAEKLLKEASQAFYEYVGAYKQQSAE